MTTINERQGIIVYVYSLRQLKALRRFGTLLYTSRRMRYVIIYTDASAVQDTMAKISQLRFVRKVEESHRPELRTEYTDINHSHSVDPDAGDE